METQPDDPGARWMLAWRAGDERAFEALVESHSAPLYRLFTRFLGPVPGREDLVQEVFVRLIESRERYEPSARFKTFLYRIAFNLSAHERERARLRRTTSLDGPGAERREREDERLPAPLEGLERQDVVDAVRAAIARLPEGQRMALLLAKYEDLAHDEIAAVMGTTRKAVKSLVHRAREALRQMLARYLEEELA